WDRTETRNDVHRPSGLDESLMSMCRTSRPGEVRMLALKRAWGEPAYGEEERELVDLAHGHVDWLFDESLPVNVPLGGDLTKRERDTLDLLLAGQSEKIVAASLGISQHTVHGYIKAIYRKTGVASRAELLALALAKSNTER